MKPPEDSQNDLREGALGRYQPIASLDQGGMARVLLALNRGPAKVKKLVVIKEIRPELACDSEFAAMFMEEARLASRLNHHNVIDIYEVGTDNHVPPRPFIVMEYLEGQSLQAVIAKVGRSKLPLSIHLRVLIEALAGLHYAHEFTDFDGTPLKIVHRDVSPENLFVCYDGLVKLVDFGIAKAAGSASRTERGKFKGKLGYVAPEQILGGAVDRRGDVFSVGVMLWEALVGRRLTKGQTQQAVARDRIEGTQPKVLEANPEAPEGLAALCERALALDPDDRFPTAADLAAALEEEMMRLGWRVGERQIASFMNSAFGAERAKIRSTIDARILSLSDSALARCADPLPGYIVARASIPPVGDDESEAPTRKLASSLAPTAPQPTPQSAVGKTSAPDSKKPAAHTPFPWFGFVLVAAIVVAALVVTYLSRRVSQEPVPAPSSPSLTAPATINSSPPALSATTPTIRLEISASPSSAILYLDNVPLASNPYRGTVARAAGPHRIAASAPGHETTERQVSLEGDVILSLSLNKQPGTKAPFPTIAPGPNASTPTPQVSSESTAEPELPKGAKPKRPIDGTDPYH